MIQDWLHSYARKTQGDYTLALREIMQQVALAGLYRSGFFQKAAFYGGTALRIFYGLQRFSEDLDFSLLSKDQPFQLDNHFKSVREEFKAQGMTVSIKTKSKSRKSNVESAFLKSETTWGELVLENVAPQIGLGLTASVKIKIEVDTQPPLGFDTEEKLLLQPFSFYVKCFKIEYLFAGKIHALLFRKWNKNVKGRDWYDMEWYIRRGTVLNLRHFLMRAKDSGDWEKDEISEAAFRTLLNNRIDNVSMETAKADISRFIPDPGVLEIWSKSYFHDLVKMMKIKE